METKNRFKEIGHYLIQSGIYLTTIHDGKFEEDNEIHANIVSFLMQSYLFLKTYNDKLPVENVTKIETCKVNEDPYLSRKDLLEMYHPVLTEYGLTQAIHINGLPFIKRGAKYFFKKSEIEVWLKSRESSKSSKNKQFV